MFFCSQVGKQTCLLELQEVSSKPDEQKALQGTLCPESCHKNLMSKRLSKVHYVLKAVIKLFNKMWFFFAF